MTPDHNPGSLPSGTASQTDVLSFRAVAAALFQGHFSDHLLRAALFSTVALAAAGLSDAAGQQLLPLALIYLPWLVLPILSGHLADRFPGKRVFFWSRLLEVAVVLPAALLMVLWEPGWVGLSLLCLLIARTASTQPVSNALVPQFVEEKGLSWGTGWSAFSVFAGAGLGTLAGGWFAGGMADGFLITGAVLVVAAAFGLLSSSGIELQAPADPHRRTNVSSVFRIREFLDEIRGRKGMLRSVGGIAAWWTTMTVFGLSAWQLDNLRDTAAVLGPAHNLVSVLGGTAVGCILAGRLSGRKIELGLVPFGGIAMAVTGLAAWLLASSPFWLTAFLAGFGLSAGCFLVPLKAFVHQGVSAKNRGVVWGTLGAISAAASLTSLLVWLTVVQLSPLGMREGLFVSAAFSAVIAGFAIAFIPGAGLRFLLFVFAHTVYRLRVEGTENIPDRGGALLVCNHMSYADGLLVIASLDRPVRCLVFDEIYNHPLVRPFARFSQAIPISSRMGPREMVETLQDAGKAIKNGDLVCIFAEGQITRTGQLLPFRRGFERVMKGVDAPVIPMHLDRVWGSLLSFSGRRWLLKLPRRIPWPVTVSFGEPLTKDTPAVTIRKAVQQLATDAWVHRKEDAPLLHRDAFATGRQRLFSRFMCDLTNPKGIRWYKYLTGVIALARVLREDWKGQEKVGICLPPSIAGSMINLAALLSGKIPVNLNYTVSAPILKNISEQCGLRTIITSKAFLEKLPLELPGQVIYAEDLRSRIGKGQRLEALFSALFLPVLRIERSLGAPRDRSVEDLATVIFSSGSTGIPKGVMLSHWNIYSNIEGVGQVFSLGRNDGILGVLPFFHSFGFMATLILPLTIGIRVAYHPTPLDAKAIGSLVEREALTFLVTTPTFLQSYTRRVEPEQFGSVQILMVGAEKLRESTANAFERKFGLRPLEGYGCTECAPVVTVNTKDFRAPGLLQRGSKPGKIGHPLPGVSIRIVDPETMEELPDGETGLMLVKGPNVMQGYLNQPERTAEAIRDGWYVTGDIAKIDEDGFIEITDRLSRFSKIGGEMVPHGKVEEALQSAHGVEEEQCFAVTGVPDQKKGERLVVLHTLSDDDAKTVAETLAKNDSIPNLWVPSASDFHHVEEIPVLGSGKLDLKEVKRLAMELSGETVDSR